MSLPGLNLCMYVYIYIYFPVTDILFCNDWKKKKVWKLNEEKIDTFHRISFMGENQERRVRKEGRKEEDLPELDARKVRVAIFIERDPSGSPVTEVVVSRGSRLVSALRPG